MTENHWIRAGFAAVFAAFALAHPAGAQDLVETPSGCTAVATVHKEACFATTIFRCGDQFRSITYRNGAEDHEHLYDSDWSLLAYLTNLPNAPRMDRLPEAGGASMSFAELAETGASPASGTYKMVTGRIDRDFLLSGESRLTGETVAIGAHEFEVGMSDRLFEPKPGAGGLTFAIEFLISRDLGVFIEGSMTRNAFGAGDERLEQTPQLVALPGEPGHLARRSEFGCNG